MSPFHKYFTDFLSVLCVSLKIVFLENLCFKNLRCILFYDFYLKENNLLNISGFENKNHK